MKRYLIILLIALMGCSPLITKKQKAKYVADNCRPETIIKDSISYKDNVTEVTDTHYIMEDSAYMYMAIACDSANQVLIKQLAAYSGKYLTTTFYIKGDVIYMQAKLDKVAITNTLRTRIIEAYNSHKSDITKVHVVYKVPKFYYWISAFMIIFAFFHRKIFKVLKKLFI